MSFLGGDCRDLGVFLSLLAAQTPQLRFQLRNARLCRHTTGSLFVGPSFGGFSPVRILSVRAKVALRHGVEEAKLPILPADVQPQRLAVPAAAIFQRLNGAALVLPIHQPVSCERSVVVIAATRVETPVFGDAVSLIVQTLRRVIRPAVDGDATSSTKSGALP